MIEVFFLADFHSISSHGVDSAAAGPHNKETRQQA